MAIFNLISYYEPLTHDIGSHLFPQNTLLKKSLNKNGNLRRISKKFSDFNWWPAGPHSPHEQSEVGKEVVSSNRRGARCPGSSVRTAEEVGKWNFLWHICTNQCIYVIWVLHFPKACHILNVTLTKFSREQLLKPQCLKMCWVCLMELTQEWKSMNKLTMMEKIFYGWKFFCE